MRYKGPPDSISNFRGNIKCQSGESGLSPKHTKLRSGNQVGPSETMVPPESIPDSGGAVKLRFAPETDMLRGYRRKPAWGLDFRAVVRYNHRGTPIRHTRLLTACRETDMLGGYRQFRAWLLDFPPRLRYALRGNPDSQAVAA